MSNLDRIWVEVIKQGTVKLFKDYPEKRGYMVRGGHDAGVVAFFVDVCERAYPVATSTCPERGCPQAWLDASDDDEDSTEIAFPEFKGWTVHSCRGGKVLSFCLIKNWTSEELRNLCSH